MGLLDNLAGGAAGSIDNVLSTLTNPFANKSPQRRPPDFTKGFVIQEFINDQPGEHIILAGDMMPMQPFKFGGEQKVVKDFYPGNSEPVTQILGPRESDMTIKGRLKAKHFKDPTLYAVPEEFQKQLDAFRVRGNLCYFSMGEWHRYGYLMKTEFDMATLGRIDYTLTLAIVGFNRPKNAKFVNNTKEVPLSISKDLLKNLGQLTAGPPFTMPKTLSSVINGYISDVASAIGVVNNFIGTTLTTTEDVAGSLNRAIGLVKNARTSISIYKRRIQTIQLSLSTLGTVAELQGDALFNSFKNAKLTTTTMNHSSYILGSVRASNNLATLLSRMQYQLTLLAKSAPQARVVVKQGDTLQRYAIKYFNNADQWKAIYDHNKLTTTQLTVGAILEIPKL